MADDLVQRAPTAVGVDERVGDRRAGRGPVVPGDRTRSRDWQVAGPACLVLVAALLSGACGGGSASPAATPVTVEAPANTPPPSTPEPPTTTASDLTPEEEIADIYRRVWKVTIQAGNPPNPGSPELGEVMTGSALSYARTGLADLASTGQAVRLPVPSQSRVVDVAVEIDGERARIRACVVDDAIMFDVATGRSLNDRVSSGQIQAEALLTVSGWRVSTSGYPGDQEGPGGCGP